MKALYPSIDIDFSVDKCVEILLESEITFQDIDGEELGVYLALEMSQEELVVQLGISVYCPTRKKRGKRPMITGNGTLPLIERRNKIWNKAEEVPNEEDQNKMVCGIEKPHI